jgi:predicted trehalose synthase
MTTFDLTERSSAHAKRRLLKTADDLRRLADTVERTAGELDKVADEGPGGYRTHTRVVGNALHEVITFLANMHMEQAFEYASEADVALAESRVARELDGQQA